MWRVKDCKIIAGEHVSTQHKALFFVVRLQKRREEKVVGQKNIKWWKCSGDTVGTQWGHSGDTAIAYKERLRLDNEKFGTTIGTVEEEW